MSNELHVTLISYAYVPKVFRSGLNTQISRVIKPLRNDPPTFAYKSSILHHKQQQRWQNMRLQFQRYNLQHILMIDLGKFK